LEGSEVRPLINLTLPAQAAAAAKARQSLSVLASQVPQETYEDVRILVTELVTNSVRHSGVENGDSEHVWLDVWTNPECLRVEVADSGEGFDKVVKPTTPDQLGGWGLQIVDRLTDRWGVKRVNDSRSTVWFEIDIRKS
jgi:anti-sigma regulatory factor (Ser/Thr protein kinase)